MEPLQTLPEAGRSSSGPNAPTLGDKVRFLARPATYSCPGQVVVRETHMSWVFMAGDRVYKLKKPVRFAYLDFSTLERRAAACRAEYLLNRRLAPDTYLGVVPLTISTSGLAISGDGPAVDWLVVMRRLEEKETLEAALRGGWLKPLQIDRLAVTLGAFYAHAPRVPLEPECYLVGWQKALTDNCRVLFNARFGLAQGCVERIAQIQHRFCTKRAALLRERIHRRRFVDAHGDLRPEHIWLREPVTIIDCLEFDAKLRVLDPLDEISFLHLECERLGGLWAAERIRRRLARALDDDAASGLFLFYRSHRAMLRARLSIAHLLDANPRTPEKWPRLARIYLNLAAADAARLERILGGRRKVRQREFSSDFRKPGDR
jgi:aminoglycoside phosphotransferase family enzyme